MPQGWRPARARAIGNGAHGEGAAKSKGQATDLADNPDGQEDQDHEQPEGPEELEEQDAAG